MDSANIMGVSAKDYGSRNSPQLQSALELVNKIQKNKDIKYFTTILDIGCGTGNITKLIGQMLSPSVEKVFGLDIDPEMINVANTKSEECTQSLQNIHFSFHISDISSRWENLHPSLTTLEGKVDLIVSNMALHWLLPQQRKPALENILRLLKPGSGWFCNQMAIGRPLLEGIEGKKELEKIEHFLNLELIRNPKSEGGHWKDTAEKVGFTNVSASFEEAVRRTAREDEYPQLMKILISFYVKKYFKVGEVKEDSGVMEILSKAIQSVCGHDLEKDIVLHHTTNFVLFGMRPT